VASLQDKAPPVGVEVHLVEEEVVVGDEAWVEQVVEVGREEEGVR